MNTFFLTSPIAESLGWTLLTVDQLIALRSAGVDGTLIRELRELGYGDLSFEDLHPA